MSFQAFLETTDWSSNSYPVPNNTYLLKDSKLFAYIKAGFGTPPVYLKKPMVFDKRGRTFVKLSGMPFNLNRVNGAPK